MLTFTNSLHTENLGVQAQPCPGWFAMQQLYWYNFYVCSLITHENDLKMSPKASVKQMNYFKKQWGFF